MAPRQRAHHARAIGGSEGNARRAGTTRPAACLGTPPTSTVAPVLPRFEVVARHRPVAVVGVPAVDETYDDGAGPVGAERELPQVAPYTAIEAGLRAGLSAGTVTLALTSATGASAVRLTVTLDGSTGAVGLEVDADGRTTRHRSRRHGRVGAAPTRFALTLTGTHLAALTEEDGRWVVRGRVDLHERCDTRDAALLAGLRAAWGWDGPSGADGSECPVGGWTAGSFGQLGLRDVRVVTEADGSPYSSPDGTLLLTATSAGPGFFDTAHTSVWSLDPAAPEEPPRHTADLFFERPDRPGRYGDHATHLLRDGDRWLVATSTWGDFRRGPEATVGVTLAESTADLTHGTHLLATRALDLPTDGFTSVGVWDPHLVRDGDAWLVGYVSARRFFRFHPVLATGPDLDRLTLRAADTRRLATEGTTLVRVDGDWQVLASDGRDSRRAQRASYPVLDLELRQTGTLEAPYPTNIPWPSVVPLADGTWLLTTFNGRRVGGDLAGYGTHGDLVVMRST